MTPAPTATMGRHERHRPAHGAGCGRDPGRRGRARPVVVTLVRAAEALESATSAFEDEAIPAVTELRAVVRTASGEVERIDDLLDVATAIGDRVDTATEATYKALTSPVIKGVAIASGTRRAAQRLRRRDSA